MSGNFYILVPSILVFALVPKFGCVSSVFGVKNSKKTCLRNFLTQFLIRGLNNNKFVWLTIPISLKYNIWTVWCKINDINLKKIINSRFVLYMLRKLIKTSRMYEEIQNMVQIKFVLFLMVFNLINIHIDEY